MRWSGWALGAVVWGCGSPPQAPAPVSIDAPVPDATAPVVRPMVADRVAPVEQVPLVLVTDAEALAWLEGHGFAAGPAAFGGGDHRVSSFAAGRRWDALRRVLAGDVDDLRRRDPKAGIGMRHPHRLFDPSWLDSDRVRLELVGVVNRLDRRPFDPSHCGELRLVYRLAYRTTLEDTPVDSRLPMTVNVVYWQEPQDGDCRAAAGRWMYPAEPSLRGVELARALVAPGRPLQSDAFAQLELKSVEVNAQLVRWPAVVHPSLAGHAEYILRVFHPRGDTLVPAPLENVPDVERLRGSADRDRLLQWLLDPGTLSALEDGTAVMPEVFAATRAVSVTPLGLGRAANRPFSQLFEVRDFDGVDLPGPTVASAGALLRRLDGLSCQGCHETRSVAGFHLLGEPRDRSAVLDTVMLPSSAHLDGDLDRRAHWVTAVAAGRPASDARPLSDFERIAGGYGSHCGLGDPALASYRCAAPFECVAMDDPQMGTCLPPKRTAGDPCQRGALRTHSDPTRDRVRDVQLEPCDQDAVCNATSVGFPGGMCTKSCASLGQGEACGAIVNLARFNNCLARRAPFVRCIEAAAFEAGMRRCDAANRCRDDYICARSPTSVETGVCLPPYFLFQLRVDGHVL